MVTARSLRMEVDFNLINLVQWRHHHHSTASANAQWWKERNNGAARAAKG